MVVNPILLNVKLQFTLLGDRGEHTFNKAQVPLSSELYLQREVMSFQSLINKHPQPTAFPNPSAPGSLEWRCLSWRVGIQDGSAGERRTQHPLLLSS